MVRDLERWERLIVVHNLGVVDRLLTVSEFGAHRSALRGFDMKVGPVAEGNDLIKLRAGVFVGEAQEHDVIGICQEGERRGSNRYFRVGVKPAKEKF